MLSSFPKVTHLASGGGRVETQGSVLWAQLLARKREKALARQFHVTCWPAQMWPSVWAWAAVTCEAWLRSSPVQVLGQDARVRKRSGGCIFLNCASTCRACIAKGHRMETRKEGCSRLMCGDFRRCTVWLVNQNDRGPSLGIRDP